MGNSFIQPSFTSGELSPELYGRVDFQRQSTALKTCRNFIVLPYGGVTRRPGTYFITETKNSGKVRKIPFVFNSDQTYVLVFGHYSLRIIHDDGVVVYPAGHEYAGEIVEVTTPYPEEALPYIVFTQSADVITLACYGYPIQQLSRTEHYAWTLAEYNNLKGPFLPINTDTTLTVTASATTGSITITASSDLFETEHNGRLMYIEQSPSTAIARWDTAKTVGSTGVIRRANSNYYKSASTGTTGTVRPSILEGSERDGDPGIEWEYIHSGFGIAQITEITSPTTATATVITYMPDALATTGSYKWAFEAWGGGQGYPRCVTYYQQRQIFGGSEGEPQAIWTSAITAYTNFETHAEILDNDAITYRLMTNDVVEIRHFIESRKLLAMTSGGIFAITGSEDAGLTPDTITGDKQEGGACSYIRPLLVGKHIVYLQEKCTQVRNLGYSFSDDAFSGSDLTVLSSHLFEGHRIVDWDYQSMPFSCIWAVRDDGVLLGFTYMVDHEVAAWHRHDTDGLVENVCVIPGTDEDIVYLTVCRTIGGVEKRYIEKLMPKRVATIQDAFFVDSGLTYDGTPATTFSGLDHLEGETVSILGDGGVLPQQVVTGGSVTTPVSVSKVHIGLPIEADIETLELNAGNALLLNKAKKINYIGLFCKDTVSIKAGRDENNLYEYKGNPPTVYGSPRDMQTGLIEIPISTGWSKNGRIFVRQSDPLPTSILAIITDSVDGGV